MLPKWGYFIIIVVLNSVQKIIRKPYETRYKRSATPMKIDRYALREKLVLYGLGVGILLVPMLWTFTRVLDFANVLASWWRVGAACIVMAASLYVFWRSHVDLRHNWSPSLQISQEQTLITDGIYTHIRHPMYAAELIFCLGQLLLLPNWVAGLSGLLSFVVLYIVRVPQEEKMMEEAFGSAYTQYKKRTGGVIPRIFG